MKAQQVDKALAKKFFTDNERLVFWDDPEGEFTDYIADGFTGELESINVIDVTQAGGLPTKLLLEREDTESQFLIYNREPQREAEQDWLLDIRLYSAEFHADVASIWLQELGLASLSLRDHLKTRASFLGNQDRRKKLAQLIDPNDDQAAIDRKMIAVLTRTDVTTTFAILRSLCHGHYNAGHFDIGTPPKDMEAIVKMGLESRLWDLMQQEFGYTAPKPSFAGLLRCLFASELLYQLGDNPIDALGHFRLPPSGQRNAVVCLTQWRDSARRAASYDAAASALSAELDILDHLGAFEIGVIENVYTFWAAEKRVLSSLRDCVLADDGSVDLETISRIAQDRKAGHWLAGPGRNEDDRRAAADSYDAIIAASELFALHRTHNKALRFGSAADLLTAYRESLYQFDRKYRAFCTKARAAQTRSWDLLKSLTEKVERVYDQGFLQPLGLEWSRLLDDGFLNSWATADMPAQQRFYANTVQPQIGGSSRKRAFVIISDAFRYEAAKELTETLNGRYRLTATISSMLGVLPSYTALGMASLLPHKELGYGSKGNVLVDGKSTSGTEARHKVLATVSGMACQAEDLRTMTQDAAREYTGGQRVVYIYHNVIDARGDTASTESETFEAVETCIDELTGLVQFCVNKLNAAKVWVTSDHGFLFQEAAPSITDKSKLSHKPDQAIKSKKRYVVGRNLGSSPEAHLGSTNHTAGTTDSMEFWIPRGANRFHFTGGARFVHGGAMPQEIVIPLVEVTQLRGRNKASSRAEKVAVQVLGTKHKITAPKHRFELIQAEAVSDRRRPITLRAAILDGSKPVSSVETVTFDSASDSMEGRKRSIRLELGSGPFDKATAYRLVLRDAETDAEVQSIPVTIIMRGTDDF